MHIAIGKSWDELILSRAVRNPVVRKGEAEEAAMFLSL